MKCTCRLSSFLIASFLLAAGVVFGQIVPEVGQSRKVCLQTWMGTFVVAEDGGGDLVLANRANAGEWETFEMTRIDPDHVSLKAANGQLLCAEYGGGAIVVANRNRLGPWETFGISMSNSGLISLQASNGKYVCAEQSGVVQANRTNVGEWEMFRAVSPEAANAEKTRIEVNVYKIFGTAPLWHTGTVIDGREYYFQTNNRVQECAPRGMGMPMHRTIVRFVPGSPQHIKSILGEVSGRWNGTRYDLTSHNCNFFTNDLLTALGTTGLDREYMDASQMAKVLRQTPGSSTVQEVLVKWPISDKRVDKAFMNDLKKLQRLPQDTRREVENGCRQAGDKISRTYKRIVGI